MALIIHNYMLKKNHNNNRNYSYRIKEYFEKQNDSLCILAKDNNEAKYLFNELKLFIDNDLVQYFPDNELLPYDHFSIPESLLKKRFQIINSNIESKNIIVSSIKNLFERFPSRDLFNSIKTYKIGSQLTLNQITQIVDELNYKKKSNVENLNEYSLRGGIIDIFSPTYADPLRIEIFNEKIESIRLFDVKTQLSNELINSFSLSRGNLLFNNDTYIDMFITNWREYFQNSDERYCDLFQKIKNGENPEGIEIYFPFFFKKTISFNELFKNYNLIVTGNFDSYIDSYSQFIFERYEDENNDINRPLISPEDFFTTKNEIKNILKNAKNINANKIKYEFNKFSDLEDSIQNHELEENLKINIASSIESEFQKLKKKYSVATNNINHNYKISIIKTEPIRNIFDEINNEYYFHKEYIDKGIYNIDSNKEVKINSSSYSQNIFTEGEYVIHEDYGLGIYSGLEVIQVNNSNNEYLKIIYLNDEKLYVPLRNIEKISSYHHKIEDKELILDSLSSVKWKSKKNKAKKRAFDHAAEILDVESRRLQSNSFVLKIDDESFEKFNDDFPYIETPDQLTAIDSIRNDIKLIKPMNRVLCGDVGFGKTEVAMRSSYISVFSNKQVVIITPSTVLCDQHNNSFLKRFENFPVSVTKLNRHTGTKEKQKIIDDFKNKKIDILITTHIAFNNNLDFSNVGLLIIDEEHKFGIKQKNFIKDKQENLHILYLSATPIPRTMNMVFSGLKDFSFLQTAPSNRINIKSFLKLHTTQLIKEALSREKLRGGQSFILQNDIGKMESLKNEIERVIPEYKVGIAHGKLKKNEIRQIMNDFIGGELDGLICTTIVEMGLDIPNANTILIINSHKLGLSQLHQLRGRVGRSAKQGYCYFLIPSNDVPNSSKARLDSIIKYSKLGEGFLIAQQDLDLRGGGEILGEKQSGHINDVGISLYLSMLKEALKSNKSSEYEKHLYEVNFYDSAYIDTNYLPSPTERLKIYKRIQITNNNDEVDEIKQNLIDRCGKMPSESMNLLNNKKIQNRIINTGIKSIKSYEDRTNFILSSNLKDSILDNLLNLISKDSNKYSLTKDNKFIYKFIESDANKRRNNVNLLLDEIL